MRMISLLVLGAFWLVACDRSTEPKVSSPSGGATAQPMNQAAAESAMPMPGQANDHSTTARDLLAAAEPEQQTSVPNASGADHAKPISPQDEPTRQELDTAMPLPGQATGEL
jgi:hypothetical protein